MRKQHLPFLIALSAILAVSGCYPAQIQKPGIAPLPAPTITFPSAVATAVMVTDTPPVVPPTPTTVPEATPTNIPTATQMAASPTSASTPAAGSGEVINASNAKDLGELTLTLPEMPEHIAWLGGSVTSIPPELASHPPLILQSGASLTPVTIGDSLALGQPVPLPLNGTQVLAMAPDGSSLVIQDPSRVAAFSLDGKLIRELPGLGPGQVYQAGYSSSGQYLALTGGEKIQAFVYNLKDESAVHLEGFETAAPVFSVGIANGGRWLAWVARATMEFQDTTAAQQSSFHGKLSFMDFIGAWEFSPDATKMALYVSNALTIYSVPDAKELVTVTTGKPVSSLAWSPDGSLLAGGYGNSLQIWDAATLAPVASLPGPNDFTGQVSFSPDGRYIFSTHDNNVIGVWKVK